MFDLQNTALCMGTWREVRNFASQKFRLTPIFKNFGTGEGPESEKVTPATSACTLRLKVITVNTEYSSCSDISVASLAHLLLNLVGFSRCQL